MAELQITELVHLLRECAGEDENVALGNGDVLDVSFEDLGYDSLAILNTVGRIERDNGIRLPDTIVVDAQTPRMLLKQINERLGQVA
ncbi:acyl carrier protein [Actinoplanes sp. NPDC026619]|uniref:acyl carrier protein n=1 Tax=Actinoplanes sp. NPDC026619 TaxID=3155798 RepID=UPI0033D30188